MPSYPFPTVFNGRSDSFTFPFPQRFQFPFRQCCSNSPSLNASPLPFPQYPPFLCRSIAAWMERTDDRVAKAQTFTGSGIMPPMEEVIRVKGLGGIMPPMEEVTASEGIGRDRKVMRTV